MTKQVINTGAVANDKTGDALRVAFTKANANFTELYSSSIAGDWTWPEVGGMHTRALLGGSQGSWIDGQSPGGLLLYNDYAVTLNAGSQYAVLDSNGNFNISGALRGSYGGSELIAILRQETVHCKATPQALKTQSLVRTHSI